MGFKKSTVKIALWAASALPVAGMSSFSSPAVSQTEDASATPPPPSTLKMEAACVAVSGSGQSVEFSVTPMPPSPTVGGSGEPVEVSFQIKKMDLESPICRAVGGVSVAFVREVSFKTSSGESGTTLSEVLWRSLCSASSTGGSNVAPPKILCFEAKKARPGRCPAGRGGVEVGFAERTKESMNDTSGFASLTVCD